MSGSETILSQVGRRSSGADVSVVIPTYNRARWLPAAVESVLTQTVPPADVVVVDDGSTDDTPAVRAGFPAPVRAVRQENAGAAAARNRGIAEARGALIAFQDSDDLWNPDKLEIQLAALARWPTAGWCIGDFSVIDEAGEPLLGRSFEDHLPVFDEEGESASQFFSHYFERATLDVAGRTYDVFVGDAFPPLFLGNFAFPQATLVRRELLERVGGFDRSYRFAEDTNLFHRLAREAPVVIVMTPLFRYRDGSYTSIIDPRNTVPLIEFSLRSLEENLARAPDRDAALRALYARGRERLLLRLAYSRLSNYQPAEARRAIGTLWSEGRARTSARAAALFAAACLPPQALRLAHRLKQALQPQR